MWTAGGLYLRNIFAALRAVTPEAKPTIILVKHAEAQSTLEQEVDEILIVPKSPLLHRLQHRSATFFPPKLQGLFEPRDFVDKLLYNARIDCIFTVSAVSRRHKVPVISWIPDFQHRYLPEMFSDHEIKVRDTGLAKIARQSDIVVLSSRSALEDYYTFCGSQTAPARVASFVAQIHPDVYDTNPRDVCTMYHLPERFFYLPNQFWKHKNHQIILDALSLACVQRPELVVVCTGYPHDYRHPYYFGELLASISQKGLRNNFIVLGFVPHTMIPMLMRQSLAILQPSRFEGWSTTIEEAKSLGKMVIASDIKTHREQNPPGGCYFAVNDIQALADILIKTFDTIPPGPDYKLEQAARQQLHARTVAFGQVLLNICTEVVAQQRN